MDSNAVPGSGPPGKYMLESNNSYPQRLIELNLREVHGLCQWTTSDGPCLVSLAAAETIYTNFTPC